MELSDNDVVLLESDDEVKDNENLSKSNNKVKNEFMELSDNDVVLLENEDKVKDDEVILVDSVAEMNFIITDVISLARDVQERKNIAISKEGSEPVELACSVEKSVGNVENSKNSPGSVSSQEASTSIVSKAAPSLLTNRAPDISKEIKNASVYTSVPPVIDKKPFVENIPNIEKCLKGWKSNFPWVQYNRDDNTFTCSVCTWGYNFTKYYLVYKLVNLHCVAAKLLSHKKKKYHEIAVKEKALLMKLHEDMYSLIKYNILETSSFAIKQKMINIFSFLPRIGNEVPHVIPPLVMKPLVIRNLALAIECVYMESLIQSKYFSVISFGKIDYMIVRWLTQDYKIVEHLFCSQLHNSKEKLSVLCYLHYRGVDMHRMVSYSQLHGLSGGLKKMYTCKVLNIANRFCPVNVCVKWLRSVDVLKEFFMHMDALPELCHIGLNKFRDFKKAKAIANAKESEIFSFVLDSEVINFIYSNKILLDEIVLEAPHVENCLMLNFTGLCEKLMCPMFCTIYLLRKLNDLLKKESLDFVSKLKQLRRLVCRQLTDTVNVGPSEYFVMSIIDMFLCHAIADQTSQSSTGVNCVDILVKNMSIVEYYELEDVFRIFVPELCGGKGFQQLKALHSLFKKSTFASPLKLLANLQSNPHYHCMFPELLTLGQMIMVLPTLNAHDERYTFDVAAAEAYIAERFDTPTVPFLVYIFLEGPNDVNHLIAENILENWLKTDLGSV